MTPSNFYSFLWLDEVSPWVYWIVSIRNINVFSQLSCLSSWAGEKIEIALQSIRPYLQKDGGDVEFVELTEDNIVKVKLGQIIKFQILLNDTLYDCQLLRVATSSTYDSNLSI